MKTGESSATSEIDSRVNDEGGSIGNGLVERKVVGALMGSPAEQARQRVASFDWQRVQHDLESRGFSRLPGLLTPQECRETTALYRDRARFRSFVDLGAKGYGDRGDYRYFAYPLPARVRSLRTQLYRPLARIANNWQRRLGNDDLFPTSLGPFLARCHDAGQLRPTPLVLRYDPGGYNCLHQDVYGAVAFPLQVACLLSRPGVDFDGGEFLLTEQRPRMQSRGEAVALSHGEGIVFPNATRPVEGSKGVYRARVRHGVSRVHSGERFTLGLIFHDAA